MTPSEDLTQTQYFDLLAPPATSSPPSFPDSSPHGLLHSPIYIDPQSNKEDEDMEIKAALPEEFSRETGDANKWLMAMEAYFTLYKDKYLDTARTVIFLNRMSKGQGKAFAEAWLTKLEDEHITDADKTWTKIKKAFKAAFTSYDTAVQAQVTLALLNQDQKNPSGFNKSSPLSPFSQSALGSPTTMPCRNGSSEDSTCKLQTTHSLGSSQDPYHYGGTLFKGL